MKMVIPIPHIKVIYSICLWLVMQPVGLLGQSDCTGGCFFRLNLNGKEQVFRFNLEITPQRDGRLVFKDDHYEFQLFRDKPISDIELDLVILDAPEELTLYFSHDWMSPDNFLQLNKPYGCRKRRRNPISERRLTLKLNGNTPRNAKIPFRAALRNDLSCSDAGNDAQFVFKFTKDEPEEPPKSSEENNPGEVEPPVNVTPPGSDDINGENLPVDRNKDDGEIDDDQVSEEETNRESEEPDNKPQEGTKKQERNPDPIGETPEQKARKAALEKAKAADITYNAPVDVDGGYEIRVLNVINLQLDSIELEESLDSMPTVEVKSYGNNFSAIVVVSIPNEDEMDRNIRLHLKDPGKPEGKRRIVIPLGNHLVPTVVLNEDKTAIEQIHFQGGQPPYVVYFKTDNDFTSKQFDTTSDPFIWKPEPDFFANLDRPLFSEIRIEISDALQSVPLSDPDWTLYIPRVIDPLMYYLGGAVLLLLLIAVVYPLIRNRQRQQKQERFVSERTSTWKKHMEKINEEKERLIAERKGVIQEGGNEFKEEEKAAAAKQTGKPGIKILTVKKASSRMPQGQDEKELERLLKTGLTFQFDTTELWQDTMVTDIYFTDKGTEKLDQFLREQNLNAIQEQEGQIPEIGGILMGRPFHTNGGTSFQVLVEEFVPIDPEYHDKYQLEFSAQSLAKDLGDIQDQFSELTLVGWFHTHPGHGLFLSRPDLRIHDSFFTEPYQFAMEIDSLTTRLDTGFFTRMKNGKVNNRKNLRPGQAWYSWIEIGNSA